MSEKMRKYQPRRLHSATDKNAHSSLASITSKTHGIHRRPQSSDLIKAIYSLKIPPKDPSKNPDMGDESFALQGHESGSNDRNSRRRLVKSAEVAYRFNQPVRVPSFVRDSEFITHRDLDNGQRQFLWGIAQIYSLEGLRQARQRHTQSVLNYEFAKRVVSKGMDSESRIRLWKEYCDYQRMINACAGQRVLQRSRSPCWKELRRHAHPHSLASSSSLQPGREDSYETKSSVATRKRNTDPDDRSATSCNDTEGLSSSRGAPTMLAHHSASGCSSDGSASRTEKCRSPVESGRSSSNSMGSCTLSSRSSGERRPISPDVSPKPTCSRPRSSFERSATASDAAEGRAAPTPAARELQHAPNEDVPSRKKSRPKSAKHQERMKEFREADDGDLSVEESLTFDALDKLSLSDPSDTFI